MRLCDVIYDRSDVVDDHAWSGMSCRSRATHWRRLLRVYSVVSQDLWRRKHRPGVDFTNILCAGFTSEDLKSSNNLYVYFALLGSVCVKAAQKMLVKSTPDQQFKQCCHIRFTSISSTFCKQLLYKIVICSFSLFTVCVCTFWQNKYFRKNCTYWRN